MQIGGRQMLIRRNDRSKWCGRYRAGGGHDGGSRGPGAPRRGVRAAQGASTSSGCDDDLRNQGERSNFGQ